MSRPVHPRERGEQDGDFIEIDWLNGSSPRARGTETRMPSRTATRRFIPASAGNRYVLNRCFGGVAVHPRERGEQGATVRTPRNPIGSSPRARGTDSLRGFGSPRGRFIPASAGNRSSRRTPTAPKPVHPRERGEQRRTSAGVQTCVGSSPRARGTEPGQGPHVSRMRFIPASAGNREPSRCRSARPTVHPRERGEHKSPKMLRDRFLGSSPRARGTALHIEILFAVLRFIPASAQWH